MKIRKKGIFNNSKSIGHREQDAIWDCGYLRMKELFDSFDNIEGSCRVKFVTLSICLSPTRRCMNKGRGARNQGASYFEGGYDLGLKGQGQKGQKILLEMLAVV